MRALSTHDVLALWEAGQDLHPVDRGLLLLAAACPERSHDELADAALGARDRWMLSLRERMFGPSLLGFSSCAECGERWELALSVTELRRMMGSDEDPAEGQFDDAGVAVRYRLPNSRDLAAVANASHAESGRRLLAERCILEATCEGRALPPRELRDATIDRLAEHMSAADPGAELLLDTRCPGCGQCSEILLDIGAFLWAELGALSRALLREVHQLAHAYHWSEAAILAMSTRRRRAYLELSRA